MPYRSDPGSGSSFPIVCSMACLETGRRMESRVNRWFDTAAFVYPTPYNFGNSGRDVVYGPGAVDFDFSVFKRYRLKKIGDAGQAHLRFEAFNLFNHPQFGQPNANVTIPQGGTITTLSTSMRQIQFGIKVVF
jgi:hypothetical protein